MPKLNHLELLNFLSEPRYLHEVARHFGISSMRAKYHIREAIKSGQVMASEQFAFRAFSDLRGKLKQKERFLYVSRNSPLLSKGPLQLAVTRDKSIASAPTAKGVVAKFALGSEEGKKPTVESTAKFASEKVDTIRSAATNSRSQANLRSALLNVHAVHGRPIERRRQILPDRHRKLSQSSHRLISQVDRIRLFEALLKQPLTFLELKKHFGVPRQTVRGLVRKRLLSEVWGPKEIGVRFKLTRKGEKYLEELHAAASFDPRESKKFPFA
jgi:hypothetical protein